MPSQLALIICTIFVLFLLRLDRKQSPGVSFALWIPTIWMLVIASRPLGLWFQSGAATIEEGSKLDRGFLIVLFCLGLIILTKRKFNWSNSIKENIWLMLLIVYMLVSILWSDVPFISLKRWSRQVIALVMAFILLTETDPRKALESLFRRIIYILIPFSYILIHYFGEYGRLYVHHEGVMMWTGVTLHKNSLSQLCLFAVFFLSWTFIKRLHGRNTSAVKYQTYFEVFVLILTFWILGGPNHVFTYSATTTVALTLGLSAFIVLLWEKKRGAMFGQKVLIVLIGFFFIYGTITPFAGRLTGIDVSSALNREDTLTGRTGIWAKLIPVAMQHPLLGHGFGGFWTAEARELYKISSSHNGYLGVLLEIGLVGLLLYAIFLLSSFRKAQRVMIQDFYWGAFWICFLLMTVAYNIAESSLNTFSAKFMAVIFLLTVSSTKLIRTPRESR